MASPNCEMTEFVNRHAVLAIKMDLKCSCEKAYVGFWPVLCRLCVSLVPRPHPPLFRGGGGGGWPGDEASVCR